MSVHNILKTFAVMDSHKKLHTEATDSTLYQRLDENYNRIKNCELISCYSFDKDWDSWEIHPEGDELVVLLSGKVTFLIESANQTLTSDLIKTGDYAIVPKGCWHTADVHEPSQVLFITPGEGTQHRSR